MKKTVLAFGEILWDILPTETILGGAPFNFAYRINSLGDAGIFVSRLGQDKMGKDAFNKVSSLEIDTSYLQWDEKYPTGTVKVSFDQNNNPDYIIIPNVAYDNIQMTDALKDSVLLSDCLCFGTLVQRSPKTRNTLEQLLEMSGKNIKLLDINFRKKCYSLDTVVNSLKKADILKLNEDEAKMLSEILQVKYNTLIDFCSLIIEKFSLLCCLITLGEKGALALSNENNKVYVPGYRVELIDSLGSGDAFTAGFIHYYLKGMSLWEACTFGNTLGAICATQKGGTQPINREKIEEFKNKNYDRLHIKKFNKFAYM